MSIFGRSRNEGRRATEIYADPDRERDVTRIVNNQCKDSTKRGKRKR
jgi:hypothetical protein